MKIGFIGMGIMGKPMAINLVKAGYDVTVSNRNMAKCEPVVAAGAKSGSYIEVAEQSDVVITMLPNGPQVKSVMLSEDGVAAHMKSGSTFIDMSSINPVDSKELCTEVSKYGIEMLDAPVSGGEPKAIDGTLSIMVGGKQETFDKYKDMLGAMGSSVVRCGVQPCVAMTPKTKGKVESPMRILDELRAYNGRLSYAVLSIFSQRLTTGKTAKSIRAQGKSRSCS